MEPLHPVEPVSLLFTKRIGPLSKVLEFYGYATQWIALMKRLCKGSISLLIENDFSSVLSNAKKTIVISDLDELIKVKIFKIQCKSMLQYVNIVLDVNFIFEKGYKFLNLMEENNVVPSILLYEYKPKLKDEHYLNLEKYIESKSLEKQPRLRIKKLMYGKLSPKLINKAETIDNYSFIIKKFAYDGDAEVDISTNKMLLFMKEIKIETLYLSDYTLKEFLKDYVISFPSHINQTLKNLEIYLGSFKNEEQKTLIEKNKVMFTSLFQVKFIIEDEWSDWIETLNILKSLPAKKSNVQIDLHNWGSSNYKLKLKSAYIIKIHSDETTLIEVENIEIDSDGEFKHINEYVEYNWAEFRSAIFTINQTLKIDDWELNKETIDCLTSSKVLLVFHQNSIQKISFNNIDEIKGFSLKNWKEIDLTIHNLCLYGEWCRDILHDLDESIKINLNLTKAFKEFKCSWSQDHANNKNKLKYFDILNEMTKTLRVFSIKWYYELDKDEYESILLIIKEAKSLFNLDFLISDQNILMKFLKIIHYSSRISKASLGDWSRLYLPIEHFKTIFSFLSKNLSKDIEIITCDREVNDYLWSYKFSSLSPFFQKNCESIWFDDY